MIAILLVDDEEFTREGIRAKIPWAELGIGLVAMSDDGVNALEEAKAAPPDILLTDIRMPRMNGIDLSRAVRELRPDCRVIFMSGYSDKEYLKSAIKLSAVGYVEKPIDLEELRTVLAKAVAQIDRDRRMESRPSSPPAEHAATAATAKQEGGVVAEMRRFIAERYADSQLSLDMVASAFSLSPSHTCVVFKEETGETVHRFITERRIERAKELLADSRDSIKTIAAKVGYTDSNYFSKIFRRATGMTPVEYRQGSSR